MGKSNRNISRLMAVIGLVFTVICPIQHSRAQSAPARSLLATPPRSLLALSKTDHMLAILDPATLKVIARIPVGEDPHEVIASSDGKTAYVTIYGGGSLHELDVLDLIAQKPQTT